MKLAQAAIRPVTLAFVVFGATVLALFASYTTTDDLKHQLTNLEYQELLVGSIVEDLEQISVRPEAVQSAQISSMRSRLQSLIDTADFCCVVDAVTTQDSLIAGLKMVGRLVDGLELSTDDLASQLNISLTRSAELAKSIAQTRASLQAQEQDQALLTQQLLIVAMGVLLLCVASIWFWLARTLKRTLKHVNRGIRSLTEENAKEVDPLFDEFELVLAAVRETLASRSELLSSQLSNERARADDASKALQINTEETIKLIDTLNAPIFAVSNLGSITLWNKTIEAATGLSAIEVAGMDFIDCLAPFGDTSGLKQAFDAAVLGQKSRGIELNIRQHQGDTVATIYSVAPMNGVIPQRRGVVFFGQDISALKQATNEISATANELRLSLDRLDVVLHSANAIVWDWNLASQELEFLGQSRETLALDFAAHPVSTLNDLKNLIHGEELEAFERAIARYIAKDKPLEMHCRLRQRDGGYRWFLLNGQLLNIGKSGAQHIVGSLLDMNDRIEQEHQIWRMAHLDALTQLPNRSLFNQRFEERLGAQSKLPAPFSIAIVDINDFKLINDAKGHLAGDRLLTEFAGLMQSKLNTDSLVARLGGDEFAFLLNPALSDEEASTFCNELINEALHLVYTDAGDRGVAFSLGMARYPEHGLTMENLLRAADTAMYQAKRDKITGSRFQLFHAGMDETRIQRTQLRDLVSRALDNDEFQLVFQPIIALGSGDVVSAEALLRWPNGPRVAIPDIISVAEDSGLILKLSEIVFDQAFSMLARLEQRGLKQTIAVNLSGVQFRYQDIAGTLTSYARANGADTHRLIIEITESVFLDNIERTQKTIRELSQHGVRVAIDDFGTGYSSLAYLQQLTVDWIKVDQSFITNIDQSNPNYQIVNAIVQMGQALNMGLVAEGVESLAELEQLAAMGCERVQGYYFSKPMDDEAFIEFASVAIHPWQSIVPEPKAPISQS